MNEIALMPLTGAALCSSCRKRLTCRYVGKGSERKPVCGPCQRRPVRHLLPKGVG